MHRRNVAFLLISLLLSSAYCCAQQHEKLLEIINSDYPHEIIEHRIDSFLLINKEVLSPSELADCLHDLGIKWYFPRWDKAGKNSDLKKAISSTEQSLEIKRKLKNPEPCSINKTIYNLGFFYTLNNNIYGAIEVFNELDQKGADYCAERHNDRDKVRWARQEMGNLYKITGEYYKAIEIYNKLISNYDASRTSNETERYWATEAYIQIANIHFLMDVTKFSESIKENLNMANSINKEGDFWYLNFNNRINHIEGNRLLMMEKYDDAIIYHKKVLNSLTETDSVNRAVVLNSLGFSYVNLKLYDLALENLNKAIILNDHSHPYNNLGDLYLAQKDFSNAMENYQKAIELIMGKNPTSSPDSLPTIQDMEITPDKIFLLKHLVTKANGWINYYENDSNKEHLDRALETFTLADQLVDLIRFENTEHQSKLYWREQGSLLYMKAVEVSYLLNRPEEAFHFMERNKALLLLEDLTNEEAKEIANLPQKLAEREFHLKREIFLSENDLQEMGNEEQEVIAQLKDSVSESKYRYEQFVDSLNESYPDYAKLKKKADILTFNTLQSNYISDERAVLHYILNEVDGYGLLTSADGPILFQLENTAQLNNDIDSLTSLLSTGISDITSFSKTSHTLFKNLIPDAVYNKITGKQLIIVPDYTLQRIPFETLVVDKAKTKYLIEDVEIAYVYSMSLLDHNKGNARNHSKQLLGLAPIHFDNLKLAELSYSESEIAGIAPFFDGEIFLNDQASKANFLKEVATPKIIHLATHADMGDGENPWIAFSDEKMYLKEIYATKNQAEMVVLSACNTLSGDLKRGEGIMSLARGFFYSGAKSVVSSLWPLTDGAGSDIMISFYQNLDKGHSKSKALRQAKLDYINSNIVEELKHPFYWAGFVVVGDNAPLVASGNLIWIFIGIVLVVAILYLFRRKFLKRLQ